MRGCQHNGKQCNYKKGAHKAAQEDRESPRGSERDRLVFAPIICKPEQRQLTTMAPVAIDLAVAQNQDSGVSAQFGATPILGQAALRHHPIMALLLLQHSNCFYAVEGS